MNNQATQPVGQLPGYITSAVPNPKDKRAPWYKNTAPTYAGIFLWFVFWQDAAKAGAPGGTLAQGVGWALVGLVISALVCHFLFYLVPGLLGMKTGLPLYIVGTSTFGAQGGFLMPGFLMGVLQFGWVGVNVYFSSHGAERRCIPVDAAHHHGGLGRAGRVRRAQGHSVRRQGRDLPAAHPAGRAALADGLDHRQRRQLQPRHADRRAKARRTRPAPPP